MFTEPGLNLSICSKMANLMGGIIHVDSKLGQGSSFTLELPLKIVEEPKYDTSRSYLDYIPEKPKKPKKIKTNRTINILTIEDNVLVQYAMELILKKSYDCNIQCVYNVKGALESFEKNIYDIVFLDMNLPDGTGIDFLNKRNKTAANAETPIIVVTAHVQEEESSEAIESGALDVILKPLSIEKLISIMRENGFSEDFSDA